MIKAAQLYFIWPGIAHTPAHVAPNNTVLAHHSLTNMSPLVYCGSEGRISGSLNFFFFLSHQGFQNIRYTCYVVCLTFFCISVVVVSNPAKFDFSLPLRSSKDLLECWAHHFSSCCKPRPHLIGFLQKCFHHAHSASCDSSELLICSQWWRGKKQVAQV